MLRTESSPHSHALAHLGCNTVYPGESELTFRRNILAVSQARNQTGSRTLLHRHELWGLTADGYKLPTHAVAHTAGECECVPGTAFPPRHVTHQFLGYNNSLLPSLMTLSVSTLDSVGEIWKEQSWQNPGTIPIFSLSGWVRPTQSLIISCVPD